MDSDRLIQTVNQTAALKMSSLRGAYERIGFDVQRAHPLVDQVVVQLKQFAALSRSKAQYLPAD